MQKMIPLPLYIICAVIAIAAVYLGLSGQKLWFVTNTRSAVIVLTIAGMAMCAASVGTFVIRGPAHPLTILGYLVGAAALFAGIVQVFNMKTPFLSDPRNALIFMTAAIIIKFVIARFSFLLPASK